MYLEFYIASDTFIVYRVWGYGVWVWGRYYQIHNNFQLHPAFSMPGRRTTERAEAQTEKLSIQKLMHSSRTLTLGYDCGCYELIGIRGRGLQSEEVEIK